MAAEPLHDTEADAIAWVTANSDHVIYTDYDLTANVVVRIGQDGTVLKLCQSSDDRKFFWAPMRRRG